MSLGDAGKKRREQIKSLRSKRTKLLNQRSMKGKMMAAQQAAQQAAQEQAQKEKGTTTRKGKTRKRTFLVTIYER